jgi:uncharacterized membrane protein YeiB
MSRLEGQTPSPYGPQSVRTGRERLVALDVLRGVAVLGIFLMNVPFMGNTILWQADPRLLAGQGRIARHSLCLISFWMARSEACFRSCSGHPLCS